MRDPQRINRMVEKLRALWLSDPDARLAQIVHNCAFAGGWTNMDIFYCEDDAMERGMERMKR